MPFGDYEVTIHRPATDVFDTIADGAQNTRWRASVVEVSLVSGDGGVGTVWHQVLRGRRRAQWDADYCVVAFDRPHVYGVEVVTGRSRGTFTYSLVEDAPGETRVALHLALTAHGAWRIIGGFLPREMGVELDTLDRLRALLA